jgi:exonuclease III
MLKLLIFIFIIFLLNYKINKLFPYIYIHNTFSTIDTNKLRILTYNVQRLPYMFRPSINIKKLLESYDIICLQEQFCPFTGFNREKYNSIIPSSPLHKLVSSGLAIYSNYPIQYIDFIRFNNLKSIDRLSDKGFLIVKINDIYVINTHLQACYNFKEHHTNQTNNNLHKIIEYCKYFNKVLICGDFNLDLHNINIDSYNKIITDEPTHWHMMNSIFNESSSTEKKGYYPFFFDGGLYKNINIEDTKIVNYDTYTDHLGVSFNILL